MKKLLCLAVLAALLVPAALFAGGDQEKAAATGDQDLSEMTVFLDRILIEEDGLPQWTEAYQALTGIEMEVVKPAHNQYGEVLGATFMAGDLPDLVEIQAPDYLSYATSGKLIPLEDFIAQNENLSDIDPEAYEVYRAPDGHIYGFPTYSGGGCVTYMRADWLENLGLDVPETWDEFYSVIRAFTFDDPDGNGKNDTIGMTLPYQVPASEFDFYNRFIMQDAYFGFKRLDDGTWVDGFTQPEMKAALKRFQDLYDEGVIDTEFFTNKTSTARTKIYEGQAGVMEYWAGTWATRFNESAQNVNPDAVVVPVGAIEGAHYINRVGPALSVTTAARNPQAVFDAFVGTMWDKGEGQTLFTYGIEGLHYKYENGVAVMMPQPSNPDRPFNKTYIDATLTLNTWEPFVPMDDMTALAVKIWNEDSRQLYLPMGGETYVQYVGELNTLKQEVFSKIVVGDLSVDAGIAEYKKKASALHIDEIMTELNQ